LFITLSAFLDLRVVIIYHQTGMRTRETAIVEKYQEFGIDYFQDEDGIFTAVVPAIRGCVTSGKTLEEAYRNAIDAIESCLEACQKVKLGPS
jgi:predicted RNase H-like HicB family nuclease